MLENIKIQFSQCEYLGFLIQCRRGRNHRPLQKRQDDCSVSLLTRMTHNPLTQNPDANLTAPLLAALTSPRAMGLPKASHDGAHWVPGTNYRVLYTHTTGRS